uniref:Uncharacterized protein n=1 Tax=Theileria annulata TaxID=5874 RepID=A0A3B0MSR8_THEAN
MIKFVLFLLIFAKNSVYSVEESNDKSNPPTDVYSLNVQLVKPDESGSDIFSKSDSNDNLVGLNKRNLRHSESEASKAVSGETERVDSNTVHFDVIADLYSPGTDTDKSKAKDDDEELDPNVPDFSVPRNEYPISWFEQIEEPDADEPCKRRKKNILSSTDNFHKPAVIFLLISTFLML